MDAAGGSRLQLWSLPPGRGEQASTTDFPSPHFTLADNGTLIAGYYDGKVRLWPDGPQSSEDAPPGELLWHERAVTGLALS